MKIVHMRQAARETIVLLQNNGGVLPLSRSASVAVIGNARLVEVLSWRVILLCRFAERRRPVLTCRAAHQLPGHVHVELQWPTVCLHRRIVL